MRLHLRRLRSPSSNMESFRLQQVRGWPNLFTACLRVQAVGTPSTSIEVDHGGEGSTRVGCFRSGTSSRPISASCQESDTSIFAGGYILQLRSDLGGVAPRGPGSRRGMRERGVVGRDPSILSSSPSPRSHTTVVAGDGDLGAHRSRIRVPLRAERAVRVFAGAVTVAIAEGLGVSSVAAASAAPGAQRGSA